MRAVQASPLLAGRLAQLEDHGKRGLAAEAAFGLGGPEAHGRKGAFNGIGGANVLPVLGREASLKRELLSELTGSSSSFDR